MKELLHHFERELAFLEEQAAAFARANPKIASRLEISANVGKDPHVERLIQSFALLAARVHKRLDDDFPLFTESLLDVLVPHYLRPFPSCAIARFELGSAGAQLSQASTVPRHTPLASRPVGRVVCHFRTAYDVQLAPLSVAGVAFRNSVQAPLGTRIPDDATALLSVRLQLDSPQASWAGLGLKSLRLALDGEAPQVAALREAFFGCVRGVLVQTAPGGAWANAEADAHPQTVGFAEHEALIDTDARSHPSYRLLTEFFAFPDKFNFVDLPLPAALLASTAPSATLHYALAGLPADGDLARLLESVSERHLLTGCTPVVNLFRRRAEPIRVTHQSDSYPVLPDVHHAAGFEVASIERVWRVQSTPQGETTQEFVPFYSLRHDELLAEVEDGKPTFGRYWTMQRDSALAEINPGYEVRLTVVDVDFNPAQPQSETLAVEVMATNRDLPTRLVAGHADGDLLLEGGNLARAVRLLRRPSQPQRFESGGALWRLISHLSVNHLSLSGGGVDALKEMLRLYDLPRSAVNRALIQSIVAVDYARASTCLRLPKELRPTAAPGQEIEYEPYPTFVRGIEVRLTVDDSKFVGTGMRLFAQVLDAFFAQYVHLNSFTQLTILAPHGAADRPLLKLPPRTHGQGPLL